LEVTGNYWFLFYSPNPGKPTQQTFQKKGEIPKNSEGIDSVQNGVVNFLLTFANIKPQTI
jgi:hypothetical protein